MKKYTTPHIEIHKLSYRDILTTSGGDVHNILGCGNQLSTGRQNDDDIEEDDDL